MHITEYIPTQFALTYTIKYFTNSSWDCFLILPKIFWNSGQLRLCLNDSTIQAWKPRLTVPVFSLRKEENTFSTPHFCFWKPTAYCELSVIVLPWFRIMHTSQLNSQNLHYFKRHCTAELHPYKLHMANRSWGIECIFVSTDATVFPLAPSTQSSSSIRPYSVALSVSFFFFFSPVTWKEKEQGIQLVLALLWMKFWWNCWVRLSFVARLNF